MRSTLCASAFVLGMALAGTSEAATLRNMEWLDRGLVAVSTGGTNVFLSWRVLGHELKATSFNLYRDGVKIATIGATAATNYTDKAGSLTAKYSVRAVIGGTEQPVDTVVTPWAGLTRRIPLNVPAGGTAKDGVVYTYSPNDGSTGDLNGDGTLDLVLKWDPSNSQDNSKGGFTGNVFLDGMTLEGTRLWRADLGVNIRAGAHYTQFVVADFDGDGKAEIICKTAPGTKDGTGKYLSMGPAASDTDSKDYRNGTGYVLSGPEYLTVFRGTDGKELSTVNYVPGRGTVSAWGDAYGNRVDRFLAAAAWLDGVKPSAVMQRGYYTRMAVTAWDWDGKTLSQRWAYDAATKDKECYGQGNHNLSVGDVDADGKDEIIEGACAINDDGKFMYRTGLGHGDAIHLGDLDPTRPGLEVWDIHEEASVNYTHEMHDAKTGAILWGADDPGDTTDNGRGLAADIDPAHPGYEMWSAAVGGHWTNAGAQITTSKPSSNFRIYWNGDLQDELLDAIGSAPSPLKIDSWTNGGRLVSSDTRWGAYTGITNNSTKSNPVLSCDLFGDWREEMILRQQGDSGLIVYTTTTPTTYRMHTLMHDPVYRAGISWQNTAYNQPPHLGFFLADTAKWSAPSIKLINEPAIAVGIDGKSMKPRLRREATVQALGQGNLALPSDFDRSAATLELRDLRGRLAARLASNDGVFSVPAGIPHGIYLLRTP